MSLKDLFGMFNLEEKSKTTDGLNVSLSQGINFKTMQSKIDSSVVPQLSLIEQTTSPHLGSIIENFSGNTTEAPLNKVNTAEYKELQALETDFNKALSAYTTKQNAMVSGKDDSTYTMGAKKSILNSMYKTVQEKARLLQEKTMAYHAQQQRLTGDDGALTNQKASTLQQLKLLQERNDKLNKLMTEGDTLNANIVDNRLQMNSAYMRYFVWLAAAVTLGLVALHKTAK